MTGSWKYLVGDVREVLRDIPDGSVQTVVTSPPYYSLRDYGVDPTIWGGNENCEHEWKTETVKVETTESVHWQHTEGGGGQNRFKNEGRRAEEDRIYEKRPRGHCLKCGAWIGCLGLEPTVGLFVEHLVEVFREVRRVLRDDGILWLNLGDSYASGKGTCFNPGGGDQSFGKGKKEAGAHPLDRGNIKVLRKSGLKPKDLIGVPWMTAFALRADGWYLRKDVVWNKPNPMPESVPDRPSSSHEYIFMLTKSGDKKYWTHRDGAGTRVKPKADYRYLDLLNETEHIERPEEFNVDEKVPCPTCDGEGVLTGWFGVDDCENCLGKGKIRRWKRINLWRGHDYFYDGEAVREPIQDSTKARMQYKCITPEENPHPKSKWPDGDQRQHAFLYNTDINRGRNLRDVWTITTQSYAAAHFATFPEKIPEICIKASTSERGACPHCGAPWKRVLEQVNPNARTSGREKEQAETQKNEGRLTIQRPTSITQDEVGVYKTVGWTPTCECPAQEPVPCIVLDPFAGSGTTLLVARRLGRSAIGIDINPEYKALAEERAMLNIPDILSYTQNSPALLKFTEIMEEET